MLGTRVHRQHCAVLRTLLMSHRAVISGKGRMMATYGGIPAAGPADSLEVRWMVPGRSGTAMWRWFACFQTGTETREDVYLLQPSLAGLSVKLRNGGALEVKSFLRSPGTLDLPGRCHGRLELWRKWSFPYHQPALRDPVPAGWTLVRKARRTRWFPLSAAPAPALPSAARAGCLVELTRVRVRGGSWWSVGFEASGPAGLRCPALENAAERVFAEALLPGVQLDLDNSMSYAQWLGLPPDPDDRDTHVPRLVRQPRSAARLIEGPWAVRRGPQPP